jgi:hypothetical protein
VRKLWKCLRSFHFGRSVHEPPALRADEGVLESFLSAPPAERWALFAALEEPLRNWLSTRLVAVADARVRAVSPDEPLGQLAFDGLSRLESLLPRLHADLLIESWAVLAEERLEAGRAEASERWLHWADRLLAAGTGDPLVEARLRLAEGLWAWMGWAPRAAVRKLREAAALYREARQSDLAGEVEVWLSLLFAEHGLSGQARQHLALARQDLGPRLEAVFERVLARQARLLGHPGRDPPATN